MTSRITISGDIGGVSMNSTIVRTAAGQIGHEVTLGAAQAGTLTTRGSATAGTLTLGAAHTIQTADVIDIYWSGGRRYNVTVGTVSGTSVPFSGGAGDNLPDTLPTTATPVTCMKQVVIDTDFDADLLVAIGAKCTEIGHLGFYEDSTLRLSVDLAASSAWFWIDGGTAVNPLAGFNITSIVATQADADGAALNIGANYESAP